MRPFASGRPGGSVEREDDRAGEVRAEDTRPSVLEPGERARRRVPVVVVDPDADDRQARSKGSEERRARRGGAAVMCDLEQVESSLDGVELLEEPLIHVLLEVPGEQESLQADPDVEDQ
jgi:hypothetical protein